MRYRSAAVLLVMPSPFDCSRSSLEHDERVIAGVPGVAEPPLPVLGPVKTLAGQLPVEQVDLLALVSERIDDEVFRTAADALHLAQRGLERGRAQVVQRVDRQDEVEAP